MSFRRERDKDTGGCRPPAKHIRPVASVAYHVMLEPGIGQFREFESPRVHTRINSWELFLEHKLICGKRKSVSEQHSMKNRRAVGLLNPMRDKIEGKNQEPGGRRTTPVTTAFVQKLESRCV